MRARKQNENVNSAFLLTYQQAADRYNVGMNTIRKLADECGAVRHFGRAARVLPEKIDAYILSRDE